MSSKYALLVGAAALLAACRIGEVPETVSETLVPLTVTSELPGTRTFITETGDGDWMPMWNESDSIYVNPLIDNDYKKQYKFVNQSGEGRTGSFSGSITATSGNTVIYAHRPKKAARSGAIFKFDVANEQKPGSLTSFDSSCDVLVSDPLDVVITDDKATADGKLRFHRVLAVTRVAVADATTGGQLSGKKIKSIRLSSSGTVLTGRVRVDITTSELDGWEKDYQYRYVDAAYSGNDWTADGSTGVFVITNPATLPKGSTLTLEVTTDDEGISVCRSATLSSDISLEPGVINTLKFNIADDDISTGGSGTSHDNAELPCPNPPASGAVDPTVLYGYGEGVTGGEGASSANVLHFNNGKALQTWLLERAKTEKKSGDHSPVTIWLSGTFGPDDGRDFSEAHPWFDVKEVSNLSFYGTDGFVMDRIGFFAVRSANIIFRNINFRQPKANNGADAVSMQECDGVWVDHCTFTSLNQTKDYEDGSTDITHGSKNVTVSWCRYINTQKSCLVGHSNSQSGDVAITATFHHNWFDGSSSRHPRVRFGTAHVYNNLFGGCTTYGAGSAYGAKVLVEYNYFDGVQLPTDICTYPAKESGVSNLQGSVAGYLYATQDVFVDRPAKARDPYPLTNVKYKSYNGETLAVPLTYNDFKPTYDYIVTPAEDVAAVVKEHAGYGKLGWTEAPVDVNNGGITDFNGSGDDPVDPDPGNGEDNPGDTGQGGNYTLYASAGKTITTTGGSYFTYTSETADFRSAGSDSYNGPFTIGGTKYEYGVKMNSSGSVSFTTSATLTTTVRFYFARRKSADTTAKMQLVPEGGQATVFDSPYDTYADSGEIELAKGTKYTIKQKAKEQGLILVIVNESE